MKNSGASKILKRLSSFAGLIIVLVVLCVIFTLSNPLFLTFDNIIAILRQLSIYGIVGIGMGFLIINGYLDLSIGGIVGLCGVTVSMLMVEAGLSMWVAMPISLLVGALISTINGLIITYTGIPAFIYTLAMTNVFRGLIYLLTAGQSISRFDPAFLAISRSSLLGIPIPIYLFFAVLILAWVILNKTTLGRSIYIVGGNRVAATFSGLNTKRVTICCYIISGVCAGICAIVLASKLSSVQPTMGASYEMEAISVAVIGGISLTGGEGSIVGILLGALILGVIDNGMIMMGISSYWQMIVKGLVIVVAVVFDILRKRQATQRLKANKA